MSGVFQPAPTYADVVLVDEQTGKPRFNPIWLDWFLNLVGILDALGGTAAGDHNSLGSIQGGSASERYHISSAQSTAVAALASMSTQAAGAIAVTGGTMDAVAITTGSMNNTPIGGTTRAAVSGTTVSATTALQPGTDAGAAQTACTLRAGTGAPNNANGNNGDYYFRSDGGAGTHIYFKTAGAWAGIV